MDGYHFDRFTRILATTRSRRKVLAALAGGMVGAIARAGMAIPEAAALPCCGVCPPPCSCVCNGEEKSCECPTCEPISCDGLCGVVDDGCGGVIDCGCCPQGCGGQCGVVGDGCGGTIDCGCCPNNIDSCESRCGIIPDGCGGTLDCGLCEQCTTPICGDRCGIIDDGCGGTFDCGCCPETCNGRCGNVSDGCGGLIECGGCPGGQTCAGGQCVVNDPGGGSNEDPPDPPDTPTGDEKTAPGGERYIVLLDGFGSSSLLDDLTGKSDRQNHGVRDRFAPIVQDLQKADPTAQLVYFSYRAGPLLVAEKDPEKGWTGQRFGAGREPVYRAANVTDHPLRDHIEGLDWIIAAIREQTPGAEVDLLGFGLGGVVALAWVAERMEAADEPDVADDTPLDAVHRVVLVNSPIGGLNPRAVDSSSAVRALISSGFDPGNGLLVNDLLASGEVVAALPDAAQRVDATSIEHEEDYVVNGERIFGIGAWLGKGAGEILPEDRRYETRLGTIEGDVLTIHRLLLESTSDGAKEARDHLVTLLA